MSREILSDYVQRRAAEGRPLSMAEVAAYGLELASLLAIHMNRPWFTVILSQTIW